MLLSYICVVDSLQRYTNSYKQLNFSVMKGIVIEKGYTQKEDTTHVGVLPKMEVGDSFLADINKVNTIRNYISINFHRHTNKVFRSTVKDQPKGKVRFWREK